jgi:hypothetical protein
MEGSISGFTSWKLDRDPQTQFIVHYRLAVWFDVPQCAWILQEEAYEQVSRQITAPCQRP